MKQDREGLERCTHEFGVLAARPGKQSFAGYKPCHRAYPAQAGRNYMEAAACSAADCARRAADAGDPFFVGDTVVNFS